MKWLVLTDSPNLTRLQEPQQLHLHRPIQLAQLVQKQRAAVSHLKQPRSRLIGSGERTLAMTKKLALDQMLGQGPAIDRHERHVRPITQFVHPPGNQFLTRARLAQYQHAGIGRSHPLNQGRHLTHRRGLAHDVRRSLDRLQSSLQRLGLPALLPPHSRTRQGLLDVQ